MEVCGVAAGCVGRPESIDELAELVSSSREMVLGVKGSGTKLDWGRPPERLDLLVDMSLLDAVVEHSAPDLVVRVQAGARLGELQAQLAESGQRLCIDPPEPDATIGGIVAANASGPRRYLYRTVRDLILGVTVVLADGTVAKSGSKVVKNVAGYDLGKLFAGSFGTLGVIAEVILRLHPLPEACRLVSAEVSSPEEVHALVRRVVKSQLVPAAVELDWPDVTGGPGRLWSLVEGATAGIDARAGELGELLGSASVAVAEAGAGTPVPAGLGERPWKAAEIGIKITIEPAALCEVLSFLRSALARAGHRGRLEGQAASGVLYLALAPIEPAEAAGFVSRLRQEVAGYDGAAVVLVAPPAVKESVEVWGPVKGLAVMRSLKERFDPDRRMSPGRFVGGI
ncbi:MAG: FAD-binding oxidoreductase [Acidimicrobiales bacterium]